jgi:hypothetical protein
MAGKPKYDGPKRDLKLTVTETAVDRMEEMVQAFAPAGAGGAVRQGHPTGWPESAGYSAIGGILGHLIADAAAQVAELKSIRDFIDDRLSRSASSKAQLEALLRRWEAEQRQGQEQD